MPGRIESVFTSFGFSARPHTPTSVIIALAKYSIIDVNVAPMYVTPAAMFGVFDAA